MMVLVCTLLMASLLPIQAGDGAVPEGLVPLTGITDTAFAEAVAAYREGRYAEAQETFATLLGSEQDRARRGLLHANAGTAAARSEHFGEAVWHLLSALADRPRDGTAARNLELVRAELGTGKDAAPDLFETLTRLPLSLTATEARWVVSGLLSMALLAFMLRRAGVGGTRLTTAAVLLAALAGGAHLADGRARDAAAARVVVVDLATVHNEPKASARELFRVQAGSVVRAEERRGGWLQVETPSGGRGWLPAAAARAIDG